MSAFSVTEGVYFAHRLPEVCLHTPSQRGLLVGQLYAYPNIGDNCTDNVVRYAIVGQLDGVSDNISINSSEGWITLQQDITASLQGKQWTRYSHLAHVRTQQHN